MPEWTVRVLLVAGVSGLALVVAFLAPRWAARRVERAPLDLAGIEGRVVLFSSRSCRRCDGVRDLLLRMGVEHTEVQYEAGPARFEAAGVPAVPLVVGRDEWGAEAGRVAGSATARRIRRLLLAAGVK